jgi:hypothetical protein
MQTPCKLCLLIALVFAAQEAAAQEVVTQAVPPPAWALGVSVGMPYAPAFSLTWRPIQSLYFGPTIANLYGVGFKTYRNHFSATPDVEKVATAYGAGFAVGGVVGGEWPRWGSHGLMAEVNGGYVLPYLKSTNESNPPTSSASEGWMVGAQVGWFTRPDQTTWQISAGMTYLGWILDERSKFEFTDNVWMPTLKLTARFGL